MTNTLKEKYFLALAFSGILFSVMPSTAAMEKVELFKDMDMFKQKGIICLTVEETIPENLPKKNATVELLKLTQLTNVKTDALENVKKDVGFSFPTSAPWCLLTAKFIKSQNFRPNLGDWGCGHGFFSRHALISGANPYAIDSSLAAANEANKILFHTKAYITENLKITDLYKASNASVIKPGDKFMNRKNDINVAFNVIHYLSPSDADLFLENLFNNTVDNGIAILCCDTPFDLTNIQFSYYKQNKEKGIKYPGYGVYSKSTIQFSNNLGAKTFLTRSVYKPTAKEEKQEKFKIGQLYKGIYPLNPQYDNGQTIKVNKEVSKANILGNYEQEYYYNTYHHAFNKFDYDNLKNVLEVAGFNVINGWYTDHNIDTLYPHDYIDINEIRKSKLVIVAQKPQKKN